MMLLQLSPREIDGMSLTLQGLKRLYQEKGEMYNGCA